MYVSRGRTFLNESVEKEMDICIHNYYLETEGQKSPSEALLRETDGASTDENPWDSDQVRGAG